MLVVGLEKKIERICHINSVKMMSHQYPLNLTFYREKTWEQPGKNISPISLKMPTK